MPTLNNSDFHLPYNPKLSSIAKQMRQNPTPAEKKLWQNCLRHFPVRVLRQRPIDNFIVDFYCAALKLVIEIDGESHFTEPGKHYDRERTRILEGYGLTVIRFTNLEVLQNFEGVCRQLESWIPPRPPLKRGEPESEFRVRGYDPPSSPLKKGGTGTGTGIQQLESLIPPRPPLKRGEPELLKNITRFLLEITF